MTVYVLVAVATLLVAVCTLDSFYLLLQLTLDAEGTPHTPILYRRTMLARRAWCASEGVLLTYSGDALKCHGVLRYTFNLYF